MAALVGIVLIGCLVFMIRQAFQSLGSAQSDPSFDRVKDLLLFINPLVGVVIGYYFNRVSTEARAENAERTAQGATATAFRAEAALGEAQARARANRSEANEARAALEEIIPAARAVLSQPPLPQAHGGAAGNNMTETLTGARTSLLVALERARAVAGRRGGEFRLGE